MKELSYRQLMVECPEFKIKKDAKEIIFTMVSAMCDNISYIRFSKKDGEFRASSYLEHIGYAFSNYQMKFPKHDIEWAADEGNWPSVIDMLNSGTSLVGEVKSR